LELDPEERIDQADNPDYQETHQRLKQQLANCLYGADIDQGWVQDGKLRGFTPPPFEAMPDRNFSGQRGLHFPEPPKEAQDKMVGFPQ